MVDTTLLYTTGQQPVGVPVFFEGRKDLVGDNLFGFVQVRVTAPLDLHTPLLQVRVDNKTISGVGTWVGTYFTFFSSSMRKTHAS